MNLNDKQKVCRICAYKKRHLGHSIIGRVFEHTDKGVPLCRLHKNSHEQLAMLVKKYGAQEY